MSSTIEFTDNILDLSKWYGTVWDTAMADDPKGKEKVMAERLADAACNGRVSDVAKLLQAGANVNWPNHASNQTPLLLAAAWGHEEVCEKLLDAKADVNVKHEIFQKSPLEYAQIRAGLIPSGRYSDPVFLRTTAEQREKYKRIATMLLKRAAKL